VLKVEPAPADRIGESFELAAANPPISEQATGGPESGKYRGGAQAAQCGGGFLPGAPPPPPWGAPKKNGGWLARKRLLSFAPLLRPASPMPSVSGFSSRSIPPSSTSVGQRRFLKETDQYCSGQLVLGTETGSGLSDASTSSCLAPEPQRHPPRAPSLLGQPTTSASRDSSTPKAAGRPRLQLFFASEWTPHPS